MSNPERMDYQKAAFRCVAVPPSSEDWRIVHIEGPETDEDKGNTAFPANQFHNWRYEDDLTSQ